MEKLKISMSNWPLISRLLDHWKDKLISAPPPPTPPLCKTLATAVVPVYFINLIVSNSARTKAVTQLIPLAIFMKPRPPPNDYWRSEPMLCSLLVFFARSLPSTNILIVLNSCFSNSYLFVVFLGDPLLPNQMSSWKLLKSIPSNGSSDN